MGATLCGSEVECDLQEYDEVEIGEDDIDWLQGRHPHLDRYFKYYTYDRNNIRFRYQGLGRIVLWASPNS